LIQHFIEKYSQTSGRSVTSITPPAAQKLMTYRWPGNVRELQNCIERAVTLTRFNEITVEDLPDRIIEHEAPADAPETAADTFVTMDEVERRYVLRVYDATGGNKSVAAKILGFNRKTLYRKLVRYGVLHGSEPAPDSER
jgi:DNA-binding NtrC family response regulator